MIGLLHLQILNIAKQTIGSIQPPQAKSSNHQNWNKSKEASTNLHEGEVEELASLGHCCSEGGMDNGNGFGGMSWADQWDYNNDPPPLSHDSKKKVKGSSSSKEKPSGLKKMKDWMKALRFKKSDK